MEGLDKSQTSAVQKILHGQLPPELEARVLQDEKMAKAVAARKELTDSIVRMQAAPGSDIEERSVRLPVPLELTFYAGNLRWTRDGTITLRGSTYAYEGNPEDLPHRADEYASRSKIRVRKSL